MSSKDAPWFQHDSNARSDEKIAVMRSVYRSEGYGFYWMIIELMRDANAYKLRCEGKYWANAIADELRCEPDKVKEFVQDCIHEFKLFDTDGNYFWSNRLQRDMVKKDVKSVKARQSAESRWGHPLRSHKGPDAIAPENDAIRIEENRKEENTIDIIDEIKNSASTLKNGKHGNKALAVMLEPYRQEFGNDMINAFLNYWTEKNPQGKKERWQMEKVFDPRLRLLSWQRNELSRKPLNTRIHSNIHKEFSKTPTAL